MIFVKQPRWLWHCGFRKWCILVLLPLAFLSSLLIELFFSPQKFCFLGTLLVGWLLLSRDIIGKSFLPLVFDNWAVNRFLYLVRSCAHHHIPELSVTELCQTQSLWSLWSAYCPGCHAYMQLAPWWKSIDICIYDCHVTFLKCIYHSFYLL